MVNVFEYCIIIKKLTPLLSEQDRAIRNLVIAIMAELKRKIPKEFSRHLKRLAPTQQRLIELKAVQTKEPNEL